jgi:hypothetical protein
MLLEMSGLSPSAESGAKGTQYSIAVSRAKALTASRMPLRSSNIAAPRFDAAHRMTSLPALKDATLDIDGCIVVDIPEASQGK